MKTRLANLLAALRRHLLGITLSVVAVSVIWFSVVLVLNLEVGVRQRPDRLVGLAIDGAEKAGNLSELKQTIRSLDGLRYQSMLSDTRGRLLVTLGDMHRQHAEIDSTGQDEADHLDRAERCYEKAQPLLGNAEDIHAAHYGQAYVAFLRRRWETALQGFSRLQKRDPHGEGWASLELLRCTCFLKLDRTEEALQGLRSILRRYSAGPIHDEAQVRVAELLVAERRRRDNSPAPADEDLAEEGMETIAADDEDPAEGTMAAIATDDLTKQARSILQTMLQEAGTDNVKRLRVLNDLLDVCILTGDVPGAYAFVRELESITDHHEEQIRSFGLLATLEESQDNPVEAENALRFCLKEFPDHRDCHAVRFRLYQFLKAHDRTDDALDVLDSMVRQTAGREWVLAFTEELLPENQAGILHRFGDAEDTAEGIARLLRVVDELRGRTPKRWLTARERLLYTQCALLYRSGDYPATEEAILQYMAETPYRQYLETILAMDAECAVRLRHDPAVRATRAHRYIATYPEAPESQRMLEQLLRAYYEMGLHEENIALAKAAFVHAMTRNEDPSAENLRLPVHRTTRWIAQSDTHLGRSDVAMSLFQRVSRRLDDLDLDLDFFLDWSQAAAQAKQPQESIRRLQVGLLRLPQGQPREQLRTLTLDARLRAGQPDMAGEVEARVAGLRQKGYPVSGPFLRPLADALLDHYLQQNPDEFRPFLAGMASPAPPDDIWSSTWALRYLGHALPTGDRQQARAGLTEIYANSTPPQHVADCLRYLDTIAELDKRIGELHERGL